MSQKRLIRDVVRSSYSGLWNAADPFADIQIVARVHLRRNHALIPFRDHMSDDDRIRLLDEIQKVMEIETKSFTYFPPSSFEKNDLLLLEEKEVLQNNEIPDGFGFSDDNVTLIINGSDHIAVSIDSGSSDYENLISRALSVSKLINERIPFAFSENYGFLFQNPLETGTGIKLSSLIHIPSLSMLKCFPEIRKITDSLGLSAVPYHEQGGNPLFCTISSRYDHERVEMDAATQMKKALDLISNLERDAREEYYFEFQPQIDDAVWRSFGVLSHSRMISYREAFEYLSNIRLGIMLSVIKGFSLSSIN
ncbi:MAG TPA: hypothetical protein VF857_08740, partial [Spirochaetota bacterium]